MLPKHLPCQFSREVRVRLLFVNQLHHASVVLNRLLHLLNLFLRITTFLHRLIFLSASFFVVRTHFCHHSQRDYGISCRSSSSEAPLGIVEQFFLFCILCDSPHCYLRCDPADDREQTYSSVFVWICPVSFAFVQHHDNCCMCLLFPPLTCACL